MNCHQNKFYRIRPGCSGLGSSPYFGIASHTKSIGIEEYPNLQKLLSGDWTHGDVRDAEKRNLHQSAKNMCTLYLADIYLP